MKELLVFLGKVISYIYPTLLNRKIHGLWCSFYTGWRKRDFKRFQGFLSGKITIVRGGKYISVGEGSLLEGGVKLLATDKRRGQRFSPEITIGKNSVIQSYCFLSAINKIEIGNNVAVTEHTIIIDNVHGDFQDNHLTFKENSEVPDVFLERPGNRLLFSKGPVIIEDNVHIGMYSVILPGTVIGHHSVIAAHSVVSRKIPPYSLVAGNPAVVVMSFGKNIKKKF